MSESRHTARWLARESWDAAARAFNKIDGRTGMGLITRAFDLGCDWQSLAHEAGLGRVDRPAATAYPAELEAA